MPDPALKDLARTVAQANKDYQYALRVYTERLEDEVRAVDKLLKAAEAGDDDDEKELEVGGFIIIPGSVKATGPVPSRNLLSQDSPFYEDAEKRARYLKLTSVHPMKAKELETLAEAVRGENYRLHAFEAQKRGLEPFSSLDKQSQAKIETNKIGIDWERVAEKVSTTSTVPRSSRECEIRWLGDLHPQFNHDAWSQTQLANLKSLVAEYDDQPVNWVEVSQQLGSTRTPIDCMRRSFYRKTQIWDQESDARLLEAVRVYGSSNWNLVARNVSEDATAQQCQNRFVRTLDPALKRGTWSAEEDAQLRLAVGAFGNAWTDVAALVPGRNNEQCRDRWTDKLSPTIVKGRWSDGEDKNLLDAVAELGPRWRDVSERLGGARTDHMCRSRYELLMKRPPNAGVSTAAADGPSGTRASIMDAANPTVPPDTSQAPAADDGDPAQPPDPPAQAVGKKQRPRRAQARTKRQPRAKPPPPARGPSSSSSAVAPEVVPDNEVVPATRVLRPRPKPRPSYAREIPEAESGAQSASIGAPEAARAIGGIDGGGNERGEGAEARASRPTKKNKANDSVATPAPKRRMSMRILMRRGASGDTLAADAVASP